MVKKYLSLEEAASILKVNPDELVRLRERGEIRGFADRGTWKFKSEDVEEFKRRNQADSNPDVPILKDDDASSEMSGEQPVLLQRTSDSDVRLILDDSLREGSDSDPEVLLASLGDSDSDVRLADEPRSIVDSGSDSDVKLVGDDSDSDVTLASSASDLRDDSGSDSDVKLVGSDTESDVRLGGSGDSSLLADLGASDSDVQLVGSAGGQGSDSDVRLTPTEGSSLDMAGSSADALGTSSDVGVVGQGSSVSSESGTSINLRDDSSDSGDSSVLMGDDSGIALDVGSSVVLEGGDNSSSDSGISLQSLADSGISLEKADSGIALAGMADSGIALDKVPDSGISLSAADSGIRLDKGKGKEEKRTVPMLKMPDEDDDLDDTQMEVAALDDEGDTYSLQGGGKGSARGGDADTGVILFDDDDEDFGAVSSKKGGSSSNFDLAGSSVDFAEAEDFSDDEDLEVAEDSLEADEELDELDVFDAADEDFEETFESGGSHAEFAVPGPAAGRIAAPVAEAEWGTGTFVGLALSTLLMSLCLIVTFDLVRTMWAYDTPNAATGLLLEPLKSLFAG